MVWGLCGWKDGTWEAAGALLRYCVNPGPGDFGVTYHTQGLDLNEIFSSPKRGVVRAGGLGWGLLDITYLV